MEPSIEHDGDLFCNPWSSGDLRKGWCMTVRDNSFEPPDRRETVRRKILSLLSDRPLTARQISAHVGIPEKEVVAHIPHIQRSAGTLKGRLAVIPAECRQCGFVFRKRARPKKPGKCPICRGESITEPLFSFRWA